MAFFSKIEARESTPGPLRAWLIEKIHQQGQRFPAAELCKRNTGQALSSSALLRHLKGKFGPLYGV